MNKKMMISLLTTLTLTSFTGVAAQETSINATIRMHTFGNLKMYKIDSAVIMILR